MLSDALLDRPDKVIVYVPSERPTPSETPVDVIEMYLLLT